MPWALKDRSGSAEQKGEKGRGTSIVGRWREGAETWRGREKRESGKAADARWGPGGWTGADGQTRPHAAGVSAGRRLTAPTGPAASRPARTEALGGLSR